MSLQVTPAGRAIFGSLRNPDITFNPVYQINIELPEQDLKKIINKAEQTWEDYSAKNNVKKKPKTFPEIYTNDDGVSRLKFRKKAVITRKDGSTVDQPPIPVYDAKKSRIDSEVPNGSEIKVGYKVTVKEFQGQYHVGLELGAVQVITLKAVDSFDSVFQEENGYVSEEVEAAIEEDDF